MGSATIGQRSSQREKTSVLQEVLFMTQVATIITFNMFIKLRSFKEFFIHCNVNVPGTSRESAVYEATRTRKGDVLEVTLGTHG